MGRVREYAEMVGARPEFVRTRLSQEWDRYDCLFFKTDCTQKESYSRVTRTAQLSPPDPCVQRNGLEKMESSGKTESLNDWIERRVAEATFYFPSNHIGLEMSRLGVASTGAKEASIWEHSVRELSPRCFRLEWADSSRLPNFHVTSHYLQWGGLGFRAWLLIAILWAVLVFWLNVLAKRIFFTDVESTPNFEAVDWKNVNEIKESYLVIGLAKSSKTDKLRAIAGLPSAAWCDLRVELDRMKSPYYTKPTCQGNVLILDHFEANLKDRECNLHRLNLLESLLYETEYRLVVVSNVDPLYFLAQGSPEMLTDSKDPEDAGRLLDRWARVLSKLTKVRVRDNETKELEKRIAQASNEDMNPQLVPWIWAECWCTAFLGKIGIEILNQFGKKPDATEQWLVSTVQDRADSYYHVLWSGLTPSERLVLYQLALDGWANPKNIAAIQQLEEEVHHIQRADVPHHE